MDTWRHYQKPGNINKLIYLYNIKHTGTSWTHFIKISRQTCTNILHAYICRKRSFARLCVCLCGFESVTAERGIYVFSGRIPKLHWSVRRLKAAPELASFAANRLAMTTKLLPQHCTYGSCGRSRNVLYLTQQLHAPEHIALPRRCAVTNICCRFAWRHKDRSFFSPISLPFLYHFFFL